MIKKKSPVKENITKREEKVLREISHYFYSNSDFDVNRYYKIINDIDIKRIKIKNDVLYILMSRPGIFIGKAGRDIFAIEEHLKYGHNIKKIEVEESKIDMFLIKHVELVLGRKNDS